MKLARFALGASVYFTVSAAQAASLDLGVFGTFQDISAGPQSSYVVHNNDQVTDSLLRWGTTGAPYSSSFGFSGLGSQHKLSRVATQVGTPFQIGLFSWHNGTAGDDRMNVYGLDLGMSVFVGTNQVSDFVFDMKIQNTADEGKYGSPDRLKIYSGIDMYRFTVGGADYVLKMLGFSFDGGDSFTNMLTLDERGAMKAQFYAVIKPLLAPPDPQAVPVPAAIWLLGSGLIGLAGVARRRR